MSVQLPIDDLCEVWPKDLRRVLKRVAFLFLAGFGSTAMAYGPTGHEIIGGVADKLLANTPAAQKIYALTDGITLERASTIADEIKAWDKNGLDDPNLFLRFADHPKIDKQLREFWKANPPTQAHDSPIPSHHWFHYTDVPILNLEKYADGKTGRSQWDVVHMISFCIEVLRGEVSESNPRRISKALAVILLAHYTGDVHQPLHVGAEYFNRAGYAVDPDKGQTGVEDAGGSTVMLRLSHGRLKQSGRRELRLHGFWDNEAVMANLPPIPTDLTHQERFEIIEQPKQKLIDQFAEKQPTNWRAPAKGALKNYGEFWADDILPVAKEAHERLRFINVREMFDQGNTVMTGEAREKNMPDHVGYADWAAGIVRDELHKGGWRLADLLSQAVGSTSLSSTTAIAPAASIVALVSDSRRISASAARISDEKKSRSP